MELISTETESMLRKCPTCKQTTTFLEFEVLQGDDKGDIKSDTYYRCLKCLHLYRQVLEKVADED